MIFVLKTSFVICVLSAVIIYMLRTFCKPDVRLSGKAATSSTIIAFIILCVNQPWIAFAGLSASSAYFTKKRVYAAGITLFMIITIPGVSIKVMAGSLQLINFSTITCAIVGLTLGSFFWNGRRNRAGLIHDYPAYVIIAVMAFITARDTSSTNILRVLTESFISFVVPYILVRNSLRDNASIRNAFFLVIAAGLAISAVALFESFMVWPMYQVYAQKFGTLVNAGVKMRGGMLRAAGPAMNPPISGAVLALCFVTAFASRDIFRSKQQHRIILFVLAAGLFSMQARVGWLGAIVGSIGVIISRRGIRAFAGYIPILFIVLGTVYGIAQLNQPFANLVGFSADAKGSSEYRDQVSDLGIEIVKAHPFIGQPIPVVEHQMISMKQGEGIVDFVNGYLSVALFSGLIGLSLFVSSFIVQGINTFHKLKFARRRGAGSFSDFGIGIVLSVGIMFPFIPTDYWIIINVILLFALTNAVMSNYHDQSGNAFRRKVGILNHGSDLKSKAGLLNSA